MSRVLSAAGLAFLAERHLATFTSLGPDGIPHVTPVGFSWDDERRLARVTTNRTSRKARNVGDGAAVVLCQVDGPRWLTLQGTGRVVAEPAAVADAVRRYAERYRQPRPNPERVVVEIMLDRWYGSASLFVS
jgi:PPOX class probable F420-dependent enzyme